MTNGTTLNATQVQATNATLDAENATLRAENSHLRQAVEHMQGLSAALLEDCLHCDEVPQ